MTRKMKDSGVEWIGMIPDGWNVVPAKYAFNEVLDVNKDGSVQKALKFKFGSIIPKTNFDSDDEYVADTITNYTIVNDGDIIVNGLNLNYDLKSLRVGLVREKGVITSAYLALRPRTQQITSAFASYLLKGYETRMALHNMGYGIRKTLGFKEFKTQPILVPSLAEQNCIADYLDSKCASIDDVIAKTNESIEEYKKLKQAVITEAVTKGVRGKRSMKDSDIDWIGQIPKEWNVDKFGRMAHVKANLVPPEEYLDFIQIAPDNIEKGSARLLDNLQTVREVGVISDNHLFHKGQILYSKIRPLLNKVVIAPFDGLCCADMYPLETDCVSEFVVYTILSHGFESQVGLVTGNRVKMPKINKNELAAIKVAFPPLDEQREIADYLDSKCAAIDTLISKKQQFIDELTAYKKSLIYEYVTGKKEVPA